MTGRHGLEIRAAVPADAPVLVALLEAAGRPLPVRTLAERLEELRDGRGTALLALDWGPAAAGLVTLHWYRTLHGSLPTAQLTTLFVMPDDRRRGIGRLLVKAAAQAARVANCGALEMLVGADPGLHAFSLATGFVPAGERHQRTLRKKG